MEPRQNNRETKTNSQTTRPHRHGAAFLAALLVYAGVAMAQTNVPPLPNQYGGGIPDAYDGSDIDLDGSSGAQEHRNNAANALAVSAQFYQLDWLGEDLTPLWPDSLVGEMALDFDGTEAEFLVNNGGAYINVVVESADPTRNQAQWVVRNLYLAYPDQPYMDNSSPTVQFRLPAREGEDVTEMWVGIVVTDHPVAQFPAVEVHLTPVTARPYHTGGFAGGGSGLSDLPVTIGPWIGVLLPGDVPVDWAWTWWAAGEIAEVNEAVNGCAPASAARSIEYLGNAHGFDTDGAQDIYDGLYEDMNTDESGTADDDMLKGKKKYTEDNGLPIDTELVYGMENIGDVMDAIDAGADVEILIAWDPNGGHAAMITSIVQFSDGSYEITYVDDPTQGDGKAENEEHTIHVQPDGSFPGGQVDGFMVERVPVLADFELDIETIWTHWVDGFAGNGTGALIGHEDPPHMETEIVHSGRQSLPLYYDNAGRLRDLEGHVPGATTSEIQRVFSEPEDWTAGDPNVLSLWIYGDPTNTPEDMYVRLFDCRGGQGVVQTASPLDLQLTQWQPLTFDLAAFAEQGVDLSCIYCLTLGIGNPNQGQPGGRGMVLLDTIALRQMDDGAACLCKANCAINIYLWDWKYQVYKYQGTTSKVNFKDDKTIRKVEEKRDLGETEKWLKITWKDGRVWKLRCKGVCPGKKKCTMSAKFSEDKEKGWTVVMECKCE
ncbi:MAG: hypothetical protein IIC50_12205 [Planctomycetes bacterium]|nr:hypothetical protein [Planctomycetota bacterium]